MFKTKKIYKTQVFQNGDVSFEINNQMEITNIFFKKILIIKKISFNDNFKKSFKKTLSEFSKSLTTSYFDSIENAENYDLEFKQKRKILQIFANLKIQKNKSFLNIHLNINISNNKFIIEIMNSSSFKMFWGLQTDILLNKDAKINNQVNSFSPIVSPMENESTPIQVQTKKQNLVLKSTFNEVFFQNDVLSINHPTQNLNKKTIHKWIVNSNNKNYNTIFLEFKD